MTADSKTYSKSSTASEYKERPLMQAQVQVVDVAQVIKDACKNDDGEVSPTWLLKVLLLDNVGYESLA
jgi:hypothetical protein